jgi:AcrR family transcriptional regulator
MARAKESASDICDTVAHKSIGVRGSTTRDARAVKSGAALRAALLALLERKAFDQISVRDICAEADIHYATFFRHFTGKEQLLEAVAAQQIDMLVDLTLPIKQSVDDRSAFHALCSYVAENRALWTILLNGGAGLAMRDQWLQRSKAVSATHTGTESWLPRDLGTICSVSLISETIAWWLTQPKGAYSTETITDILYRLVARSTFAPE